MKVKKDHYAHMREKVRAALPTIPSAQEYASRGMGNDPAKRHRWDALYAAGLSPWICSELYSYCNDDHIDTALRAIVKEHTGAQS